MGPSQRLLTPLLCQDIRYDLRVPVHDIHKMLSLPQDFGVWNVSYKTVDCLDNWAGASNAAALGSVDDGSSVCCPANPTVRLGLASLSVPFFHLEGSYCSGKRQRHLPVFFRRQWHPVRPLRIVVLYGHLTKACIRNRPDTTTTGTSSVLSSPRLAHALLPLYPFFVLSLFSSGYVLG